MSLIKTNLSKINERIKKSAEKSGRSASEVTLVAVTKTRSLIEIDELEKAGAGIIGESRVQELVQKFDALKGRFAIHFLGHLQTNKVKQTVTRVEMIQSVDSLRLMTAIDAACADLGITMSLLLQVNASYEEQKHGFAPTELP